MRAMPAPSPTLLSAIVKNATCWSAFALTFFSPFAFGESATTTTLTITANGAPLTKVDGNTVVRLTGVVMAGSARLTVGQVKFCKAEFQSCEDFRQVGMAQLTGDGTAIMRFIPGPGVHHYKAVFAGTTSAAPSSSNSSMLTVKPAAQPYATRTSMSATGSNGSYTLTANVTGPPSALPLAPGGTVYFQDRSDSDAVLGKGVLPSGLPAINYTGGSQALSNTPSNGAEVMGGLAIGDFNADGKPDVVLCKPSACPAVALGKGDGSFRDPPSQPTLRPNCRSVQVGDFDMDGKLDLIVSYGDGVGPYTVSLFRGAGDGTFLAATNVPLKTAGNVTGFVEGVADFNQDGIPDLLVNYHTAAIGIALGDGEGGFRSGWMSDRWNAYQYAAVGDFDGDGFEDFAVSHSENDAPYLGFFFGSADGSFTELDRPQDNVAALTAGDFNGDGRADLAVVTYENDFDQQVAGFELLAGHADRTFSSRLALGVEPRFAGSGKVFLDDFNQDGIADAALLGYSTNSADGSFSSSQVVLLGNSNGSFTQATRNQSITATGLQDSDPFGTADFNGDGIPDVAATGTQANTGYQAYGALLTQVGQTAIASIRPPVGSGDHEVVARYTGNSDFVTSVSKPIALTAAPQGSPVATLSSSFLQFGEQPISTAGNAQTVVLTNTGTGALQIGQIAIEDGDGNFAFPFATSNNCPASLAAGASCQIRVRFAPGSAGNKIAFLQITDNAGNSPQAITLTGVGVKAP